MNKKSMWYLSYIIFVGLGTLILGVLFLSVLPTLRSPDATRVFEEAVIEVVTTGPVEVIAYTDDGSGSALLVDENGEVILTTTPGLMPGYYEGKGVISTGKYTVEGGPLGLRFVGEGFVSYKNEEADKATRTTGILGCVFYWLTMSLFWIRVYPRPVES